MMHICKNCLAKYLGRKNKIYCSVKCRDHIKWIKRKNNPHYKSLQKIRNRKYDSTHKDKRRLYRLTHKPSREYKDLRNKIRNEKKYWLEQYWKHREKHLLKARKHRKTLKGKLSNLKSNERRRKKVLFLTGKSRDQLSLETIKIINERDKVCVYCGKQFDDMIITNRETIDHLDCNKPLSESNAVKCCWSCNASKRNIPINKIKEWIKRRGFTPEEIVYELINKQEEK